jgi:hypothetical protein
MEDQPVAKPLPTHRINAHISMPGVGFEPTVPALERAKTVHALDRAATVIGSLDLAEYTYVAVPKIKIRFPVLNSITI